MDSIGKSTRTVDRLRVFVVNMGSNNSSNLYKNPHDAIEQLLYHVPMRLIRSLDDESVEFYRANALMDLLEQGHHLIGMRQADGEEIEIRVYSQDVL